MSKPLTPFLALNIDALKHNLRIMDEKVASLNVSLRPHLKTCKSIQVFDLIEFSTERKASVSTLAEAKYLHENGIKDICYTVPISSAKFGEVLALQRAGARIKLLVDTAETAAELCRLCDEVSPPIEILLEVDTDGYRGGFSAQSNAFRETVDRIENSEFLSLLGVYVFAGKTYTAQSAEDGAAIVENCRQGVLAAAQMVNTWTDRMCTVVMGGSPVAAFAKTLEGIDELCAGVYMFQDLFQAGLVNASLDNVAVRVVSTVIGANHQTRRLFIDAGALALSQDKSSTLAEAEGGYGLVADPVSGKIIENLIVSNVSQEHGHIEGRNGVDPLSLLSVGSLVCILPNHVCMTAACYDQYQVSNSKSTRAEVWPRINGW